MPSYFKWNKGAYGLLSQHFSTTEFSCSCHNKDCVEQKISMDLIQKLERVRSKHGIPVNVTSGYRCQKHQDELAEAGYQTAKFSQHVLGNAADITSRNISGLLRLCEQEFEALGVGSTFLHVDTRVGKLLRWAYS